MIKHTALALLLGLAGSALAMDDGMAKDKGMAKDGMAMEKKDGMAMEKKDGMAMDGKGMEHKDGMAAEAEFGGNCPVALAKMGAEKPGDAQFASHYKGKTYYCSSAQAKKMFDKDPKGLLKKAEKAYKKMTMKAAKKM